MVAEKMTFFDWLMEEYGIDQYKWDDNYDPSRGQGREIWENYQSYLTD